MWRKHFYKNRQKYANRALHLSLHNDVPPRVLKKAHQLAINKIYLQCPQVTYRSDESNHNRYNIGRYSIHNSRFIRLNVIWVFLDFSLHSVAACLKHVTFILVKHIDIVM